MYDPNNIFAKILRKEIPSKIVYEDDKVLFINDINPQAKIHILCIPKTKAVDFCDFISKSSQETVCNFYSKINKIIKNHELEKTGFRLVANSGKDANQEVPHFHIHILGGETLNRID